MGLFSKARKAAGNFAGDVASVPSAVLDTLAVDAGTPQSDLSNFRSRLAQNRADLAAASNRLPYGKPSVPYMVPQSVADRQRIRLK